MKKLCPVRLLGFGIYPDPDLGLVLVLPAELRGWKLDVGSLKRAWCCHPRARTNGRTNGLVLVSQHHEARQAGAE